MIVKKLLTVLTLLALVTVLALGASAATVYVKDGGSGTGMSESTPVGTLADAFTALDGKGGEIVVLGNVSESGEVTVPEQSGDLVIKAAQGGGLTLTDKVTFAKNTNDNIFTFDLPVVTDSNGFTVYGGFNSIHFAENFTVDGYVDFYGGVYAVLGNSSKTDEVTEDANLDALTDLPYSVTVDNGTFRIFQGGNYRYTTSCVVGSVAGDLTVTVNGGTFTRNVSYTVDSAIKNAYTFSLSGGSLLAANATLVINGGTFDMPLYVHGYLGQTGATACTASVVTYSDAKYYAADGDITVAINGGTFTENCIEISAEQTAASYNRLHRGNYLVTVSDKAVFEGDTLFDATQVKPYAGDSAKATLVTEQMVAYKRFDIVNGERKTYTEPLRIACIGDSITEGVGASNYSNNSYPARLLSKAVKAGKDVVVSNYGNSGSKTMDFEGRHYNKSLAYILSMYETDADYILIGLGTNDARMTTYTYGYADRFYDDYTALLRGYGERPSTKVVYNTSAIFRRDKRDIATVSNIHPMQRAISETLNAEAIASGKDERYTFVDLYALTLEDFLTVDAEGTFVNLNDSVHPNNAGYIVYADAIYDALFNGVTEVAGFKTSGDLFVSANGTNTTACTKEAPTSNLSIAFSRAADGATVHIVGEFAFNNMERYDWGFSTPTYIKDFSIVGEGEGAKLTIDSDMFFVKGDLFMDNITLGTNEPTSKHAPLHICLGYNDVTFGESFKTLAPDGTQGGALLIAGVVTLPDDPASGWFNTRKSVSFDRDCTVTVNGGDYVGYIGGNALFAKYTANGFTYPKASLYGTYSGDMTVTLGSGVTIGNDARNGAVGQNYLTGSITLHANAWADGSICEYGAIGNVAETASYDAEKNTGTVTVNSTAPVVRARDINGDGNVNVADAIAMLHGLLRTMPAEYHAASYFHIEKLTLLHVLELLRYVTK